MVDLLACRVRLPINPVSGAVGLELAQAGSTKVYLSTDGVSYAQLVTGGNFPINLLVNSAIGLKVTGGGADYVSVAGGGPVRL